MRAGPAAHQTLGRFDRAAFLSISCRVAALSGAGRGHRAQEAVRRTAAARPVKMAIGAGHPLSSGAAAPAPVRASCRSSSEHPRCADRDARPVEAPRAAGRAVSGPRPSPRIRRRCVSTRRCPCRLAPALSVWARPWKIPCAPWRVLCSHNATAGAKTCRRLVHDR